jgi:two-component system response regulator EvgA
MARILIIDDDSTFRALAVELLLGQGFDVVGQAGNAADGLAAAERLRPSAVLVDVNLPDSDGYRVAAALAAMAQPPRVLLTSADPCGAGPGMSTECDPEFIAKIDLAVTDLARYLI